MSEPRKVVIDGVIYVPQREFMSDEVKSTLACVYGQLWAEAYYDPYNDSTRKFAAPLADKMMELNKVLKFRE